MMWHLFIPNTLPIQYQYTYPAQFIFPLRSDPKCSFNFFAVYKHGLITAIIRMSCIDNHLTAKTNTEFHIFMVHHLQ